VQVLYQGLHPLFRYDVVNLQVLEREGWYHSVAVDSGVLQDMRRRPLAESLYAHLYRTPKTTVVPIDPKRAERAKGPGAGRTTRFSVWVPVEHQGQVFGSVNYQSYRKRNVPTRETAFLDEIHRHLGVLIANASLNELTRNQARRLQALNSIARALASTLDESSVIMALHSTLKELLPVDAIDMVALPEKRGDRARMLHYEVGSAPTVQRMSMRSNALAKPRSVMQSGARQLTYEPSSSLWVPINEGGLVRGAFAIHCARPYAYEESTGVFLEQVSDAVALALRNARSYEAIEAHRRRLEVVNSIGRRLASSLDRWSIVRILREELSDHLDFDGFILATITDSKEGPIAEGYQHVAGIEEVVPPVPLAVTGPSREAYETGSPVLVRRSPWARAFERKGVERERWTVGSGAAVFVSGAKGTRHLVSRSFVWVPVVSGDRITALLSLQSYHDDAFDDGHVRLLQDIAAHVSLALANADNFAQAQAERARLEALHRMMNAILRHSPVGVILEDSAGRIVYANPEVQAIYRVPAHEMAGKTPNEVYAAAGATLIETTEPGAAQELQMSDPDRIVQVRRVAIPNVGEEPAGVLTLHEDVTASRLALEAKDLMLRAIGHEVRSPAAAMKSTLAGIIQWDASLDQAGRTNLLHEAYESSARLLALVENQLIIAKLETRQFEPNPEPVEVRRSLEVVLGLLRHRYGNRVDRVDIHLSERLPVARCEPVHLGQVLTNLIGNALEYTTETISVTARATRSELEITVADHGAGLPQTSLDSLFEKTGQAGRNRSQGGLGLGLYLCRLVVERSFGGRIWVSETGQDGTTFKFTVPTHSAAKSQALTPRVAQR
jgi:K+-sensing histidine kinase KdpD